MATTDGSVLRNLNPPRQLRQRHGIERGHLLVQFPLLRQIPGAARPDRALGSVRSSAISPESRAMMFMTMRSVVDLPARLGLRIP